MKIWVHDPSQLTEVVNALHSSRSTLLVDRLLAFPSELVDAIGSRSVASLAEVSRALRGRQCSQLANRVNKVNIACSVLRHLSAAGLTALMDEIVAALAGSMCDTVDAMPPPSHDEKEAHFDPWAPAARERGLCVHKVAHEVVQDLPACRSAADAPRARPEGVYWQAPAQVLDPTAISAAEPFATSQAVKPPSAAAHTGGSEHKVDPTDLDGCELGSLPAQRSESGTADPPGTTPTRSVAESTTADLVPQGVSVNMLHEGSSAFAHIVALERQVCTMTQTIKRTVDQYVDSASLHIGSPGSRSRASSAG